MGTDGAGVTLTSSPTAPAALSDAKTSHWTPVVVGFCVGALLAGAVIWARRRRP
jgi:hypothetical protein